MIGKVPPKRRDGKSSIKQAVDYALGISKHREDCILHVGLQHLISAKTAAGEMTALAEMNQRCKDPVFHFVFSWREHESPNSEQFDQAAKIALKNFGLLGCQAIWCAQSDTDNIHLHVVCLRLDPVTGHAIQPNGGWTYKAIEKSSREIELAQGWKVETTGHLFEVAQDGQVVEKARDIFSPSSSQKARDIETHTGEKSAITIARQQAASIIKDAKSWPELHERLFSCGIKFKISGTGAVLDVQGVHVKLSNVVGKNDRLSALEARLGKFQGPSQNQQEHEPTKNDQQSHLNAEQKATIKASRERLREILKTSQNWYELHERLAECGTAFIVNTGGAILNVEGKRVKASSIDRSCSLSKLEKRLGKFQPRQENVSHKTSIPTQRIADSPDVHKAFRVYTTQKTTAKASWEKNWHDLQSHQSEEWITLKAAQKKERDELWKNRNWKGRGTELNLLRSILAAKHAGERLDLKERQRLERKKLKKSRLIFPTFEDWLKLQENEALPREFRYKQDTPILTTDGNTNQKTERIIPDIRDYNAKILGNRVAWFKLTAPEKIDFIDHGKQIVINDGYNKSTILAAMQLAVQKWGKVRIHGTDERYRQLCVKVAAEHNYTLCNKDLAIQVEERRKQIRAQCAAKHVKSKQASNPEVRTQDSPNTTHDEPIKEEKSLWKRFSSKFQRTPDAVFDNSASSSTQKVTTISEWQKDRGAISKTLDKIDLLDRGQRAGDVIQEFHERLLREYPGSREKIDKAFALLEKRFLEKGFSFDDRCPAESKVNNAINETWDEVWKELTAQKTTREDAPAEQTTGNAVNPQEASLTVPSQEISKAQSQKERSNEQAEQTRQQPQKAHTQTRHSQRSKQHQGHDNSWGR